MNSIKNNQNIGRDGRQHIYKNYNDLKNLTLDYNEYRNTIHDIEKFRNINISKDYSDDKPTTSKNDRNKSLIPKLKSNLSKAIIKTVTGEGYNKIKIDHDLLKKSTSKVRYVSNNRKINNNVLKDDYQISDNMKNAILKNKNINNLTKNEYDVYKALEKYQNNDKLQLFI